MRSGYCYLSILLLWGFVMPNYLYRCEKCGNEKESMQAVNDRNIFDGFPCRDEKCSGEYKRVVTESNFKIEGYSEKNGYSKEKK